jgi:hypothetical protein
MEDKMALSTNDEIPITKYKMTIVPTARGAAWHISPAVKADYEWIADIRNNECLRVPDDSIVSNTPLFNLGQVFVSDEAVHSLGYEAVLIYLNRFVLGDWKSAAGLETGERRWLTVSFTARLRLRICRSANGSRTFIRFAHERLETRRHAAWLRTGLDALKAADWQCPRLRDVVAVEIPMEMERELSTFSAGRVVITSAAREAIHQDDVNASLAKHLSRDWQDCSVGHSENVFALGRRLRIMTDWRDRKGLKFWIATEDDRSTTTILLESEFAMPSPGSPSRKPTRQ